MAQVTYTNLFSESRNNIVTLLSNSSNVPDPTISSAEHRKWIYSREPDVKASDFSGYPYFVINPSDVDIGGEEEKGNSLDMKSKYVFWDIMIDITTSDRGYGGKDGLGLSHMDSISNSIIKTLLNKTNRQSLSQNSMKFATPRTSSVTTEIRNNELVFNRSIIVSFKSKIQVSA